MAGGAGFMVDMQATLARNRKLLIKRKSLKENPYTQVFKRPLITNYDQLKKWRLAEQIRRKEVKMTAFLIWFLAAGFAMVFMYLFII
ncbi:MAG: hypothetical protein ACR2MX_10380 [Cyclobacteriaceae bacterium]